MNILTIFALVPINSKFTHNSNRYKKISKTFSLKYKGHSTSKSFTIKFDPLKLVNYDKKEIKSNNLPSKPKTKMTLKQLNNQLNITNKRLDVINPKLEQLWSEKTSLEDDLVWLKKKISMIPVPITKENEENNVVMPQTQV